MRSEAMASATASLAAALMATQPVEQDAVGVASAFLVDGFVYALVAAVALLQLVRNCCRYRPWTVQKMIHLLMVMAALGRAVFLVLVGLDWCGVLSGKVSVAECTTAQRDVFYMLDQLPILAFFAIYALLVQFWAEVYYNAVDELSIMNTHVKPAIKGLITTILLVQVLFWVFYASAWRTEHSFFTKSQAILNMLMFLNVTTGFIYFGRKAYIELRSVPVELGIRSRKLKELATMTSICTSCFMTRCALQIYFSTEKDQLHDRSTWFLVIVYYALLEIIPSLAILYFNRRIPARRRISAHAPIIGGRWFGGGSAFNHADSGAAIDDPLRKSLLHSEL